MSDESKGSPRAMFGMVMGMHMTVESWLQAVIADARRRGLPELTPMLETLARATATLRASALNDHAGPSSPADPADRRQSA